jgi:hypothetical protein
VAVAARTIEQQCGPDEWQVCVMDKSVAVLRDGRRAPRGTVSRNLHYPLCYRDSSEIRRPAPTVPKPGIPALRLDAAPAQDRNAGRAQGAVAMTGNPDLPGPGAASSSIPPLNYYGELARNQWEGCLPDVYQQIRDPGAFFSVLGEVIAHRIDELADHLAGDDQYGEGYLAKVARLTAARGHAQQRVLAEYLLLPPATDMPADDDHDDDEPAPDQNRPVVVHRGHPSWVEVDAEQRERLGDPHGEEGRP